MEKPVGRVTHVFPKIGVAVVALSDDLRQGDEIRFTGPHTDFTQKAASMQVEHKNVDVATPGMDVGLKVKDRVREHDVVYILTEHP